jgi:hypothetical protein
VAQEDSAGIEPAMTRHQIMVANLVSGTLLMKMFVQEPVHVQVSDLNDLEI